MRKLYPIFLLFILPACASISEGRSQEIMVNTNPPGADCELIRNSETIGNVSPTPGGIYIEKSKYDITVKCHKKGYETATYLDHSGIEDMTFGNIVFGGLIGWGIDSATGSDNKYETPVNITLNKK